MTGAGRCADCRTCRAPAVLRAARTTAAAALHVVSLGMSLLASRAGAHCPRCGHLPSRHRPPSVQDWTRSPSSTEGTEA